MEKSLKFENHNALDCLWMPYILFECAFYTVLYYKYHPLVLLYQNTTVEQQALTNSHKYLTQSGKQSAQTKSLTFNSIWQYWPTEGARVLFYCQRRKCQYPDYCKVTNLYDLNASSTVRLSNLSIAIMSWKYKYKNLTVQLLRSQVWRVKYEEAFLCKS